MKLSRKSYLFVCQKNFCTAWWSLQKVSLVWVYTKAVGQEKNEKDMSTPTPTPVSFTRSQQTVMIIMMVLCLHPSSKKSLNAKTRTRAQEERLRSHPFYHLWILIKHSSEWTCVTDLIEPPATFTESQLGFCYSVIFQKLTSSFSAAYRHILLKMEYDVMWEYFGTYSTVRYGPILCKTPAIFTRILLHAWHLGWTVSSIGAKLFSGSKESGASFVRWNVAKQTSTLVMAANP